MVVIRPLLDADLVVQHLGQRRQAVGRARGIGDHGVAGLQHLVVDAVDDGRVDVLAARRRDHDLLRAARQMCLPASALVVKKPVHSSTTSAPTVAPGHLRRVALREHLDAVAVDDDGIAVDADLARELAVRGVVLGQVRIGLRVAEIVDRDDLDFLVRSAS